MPKRPNDTDVGLAQFKARLSAYLRRVRQGEALTVLNRDTPIARVVPWEEGPQALQSRPARRRLADVVLPKAGTAPKLDSLKALREERQKPR